MANNYTDSFAGEPYFIKKGEQLSAAGMTAALNTKEKVANKKDTINNDSTEYPSSKAVYDGLNAKDSGALHKAGTETITGVKTFGTTTAAAEPLLGVAKTDAVTNTGTKFATEAQVYAVSDAKQDKMTTTQQSALNSGITASKVSTYDDYFANLSFFPTGTILTFSAAAWDAKDSAFKNMWKVCDGAPGSDTPNLVGKFLCGAAYPAGGTGGADSVTLKTENLPAHDHGGKTDQEGKHRPNLTVVGWKEDSGVSGYQYQNNVSLENKYIGGYNSGDASGNTAFATYTSYGQSKRTGTESISEVPAHTHTITSVGSGSPFSILPSYYTVIYIIKIA
ncbi:MAG: hypothetical protein LBL50_00045 [Candidatus Margulisbacteria bacterium]|jgi:hypothetical protein|nr:hypothetical protein [Candidatus Margulisiibacteriota bacterium]